MTTPLVNSLYRPRTREPVLAGSGKLPPLRSVDVLRPCCESQGLEIWQAVYMRDNLLLHHRWATCNWSGWARSVYPDQGLSRGYGLVFQKAVVFVEQLFVVLMRGRWILLVVFDRYSTVLFFHIVRVWSGVTCTFLAFASLSYCCLFALV